MANVHPCPDCGGIVSGKALRCPHCGRPFSNRAAVAVWERIIIYGIGVPVIIGILLAIFSRGGCK